MKKCFFTFLANDFEHISNDASNFVLIASKLKFSNSTILLKIQMFYQLQLYILTLESLILLLLFKHKMLFDRLYNYAFIIKTQKLVK